MNNEIIRRAIQENLFSGCAVAFSDGVTSKVRFFGDTHDGPRGQKVNDKTLFDIASHTKVHVFLGILRLVSDEVISLEDRVAKFLPFTQLGDIQAATIRDLLSCKLDFVVSREMEEKGIHLRNERGRLRIYDEAKLRGSLRTMFRYGNLSAFFAGKILEVVMQCDLEKALDQLVFEPLCMSDTSFTKTDERLKRIAPAQSIPKGGELAEWQFDGLVQDPMSRKFNRSVGIAGLFSSIYDQEKIPDVLARNRDFSENLFLREPLWRDMVSDQHRGMMYREGVHRYGLGIDMPSPGYVDDEVFCESGLIMSGASGSFMAACPAWSRKGLRPRPISLSLLLHGNLNIPRIKERLRNFRREFLGSCLDDITE